LREPSVVDSGQYIRWISIARSVAVRRRIDNAFNVACGDGDRGKPDEFLSPRKKRRVEHFTSDTQGGFFLDDIDQQQGGFLIDDPSSDSPTAPQQEPAHIPLSRIPDALQILDLQPDDPEVLAVFRNAASGWSSRSDAVFRNLSPNDRQDDHQMVSRDDWRAVCGVLLDTTIDGTSEPETGHDMDVDDDRNDVEDSGSDEYVFEKEPLDEEFSGDEVKSDDDYYVEGPSTSRTPTKSNRARKGKGVASSNSAIDGVPGKLTARQTLECRKAFALFFPDVTELNSEKLDNKRIMIQDISRVATLLNEKLKAEEIVEMLETFSTSNDKSMSLRDFERMMITAKLA